MTTETIESQVVHLESLYKAYGQILDQAKQQLENLEVTPSTIESLSQAISTSGQFKETIAASVLNSIRTDLRTMDSNTWNTYATSAFLRETAARVVDIAKPEIKQLIETLISEVLNSPAMEKQIENKILQHDGVESALKIQKAVTALMKTD